MQRIDTHQHLLLKNKIHYPWAGEIPLLKNGSYELEDYWSAAENCEIASTLFMESDASPEHSELETKTVYALAENAENRIGGIIACARPEETNFETQLDRIAHPKLVGIRRILHTQDDSLPQSKQFRENLAKLANRQLVFDLCVLQRQLPLAIQLVQALPSVTFVLDHCGIPDMINNDAPNGDGWLNWKNNISHLAEFPNVCCKVSGIIVCAAEHQRTVSGLRPYIETAIETFGWERVVWGGDWPVCQLTASLKRWCSLIDEIVATESLSNQSALFRTNAQKIYNIQPQ